MALPVIADCYRVVFNWEGDQRTAENVMHIGSPSDDTDAVLAVVRDAIQADMWQCVSDLFNIVSIDITPLDGSLLTSSVALDDSSRFGGQGGSEYIPNASALVKHTTATGGRSGRGRTYLPALSENRQANGLVAATQRGLTTTAWQSFNGTMQADSPACALVIASYKNETLAAVTASVCEAPIATQRRRNKRQ